jgi:large subunit ribosomal protein L33
MRTKVILVCEECLSRNYTTSKNPQKNTERIELKKYCKTCNKYTIHKETK